MTHKPVTTQQSVTTYDPEEMRRYMVSQTNERLLAIVTQERAEYIQPALNLAEAELRLRGVPFTVSPPAPVQAVGPRKARWQLDDEIEITKMLAALCAFLYLFSERIVWLSAPIIWLVKLLIACGIGFLTLPALFECGERLLAWWRRSDHP
jgi:hypothetical protein